MLAPKKKMEESSTCVAFCVDRNPTNYGFVRAARVLIFPLSFVESLSKFQTEFILRAMFINVHKCSLDSTPASSLSSEVENSVSFCIVKRFIEVSTRLSVAPSSPDRRCASQLRILQLNTKY